LGGSPLRQQGELDFIPAEALTHKSALAAGSPIQKLKALRKKDRAKRHRLLVLSLEGRKVAGPVVDFHLKF
jgi:hypothetical protein